MDSLDDCEISAMEHSSFDGNQSSVLESLNEDSDENKLEITRNPFDSNLYDKDNFPSLDASVFTENRTPDSRSPAEFRWSIDQIAKLKPADLDMYPNQEYSVMWVQTSKYNPTDDWIVSCLALVNNARSKSF